MKKRILLLLICLLTLTVSLCLFTACKKEENSNGDGGTTDDGTTEGGTVEGGSAEETHTHSFTSKSTTPEYLKSPATATSDAIFYYKCTECVEKGTETYTYRSEGLEYEFSSDETYYIVTTKGTCTDTNLVIPSVYENKPVKEIGDRAFIGCDSLTSVVISDSVTAIGDNAFHSCTGFTSIMIGNSVTAIGDNAFRGCTGLTSVVIPDSVTSIGEQAFNDCYSLTSVTIGNSVTSIGEWAFFICYKLVEVIDKSSLSITKGSTDNGYVGYHPLEVHNGESKIVNKNDYLFYTYNGVNYLLGYTGIDTALTLPNDYNGESYKIYKYAFYLNDKITSITMPNSATSIGDHAFSSCDSLTSITIPDSVTSIGKYAFNNCNKLVEVIDKSSLNITKGSSDNGCVGAYALEVHNGESKIVNKDGYLFITYDGVNYLLGYTGTDTALMLPNDYNGESYEIYKHAFAFYDGLTSATIGDGITSIGDYAFYNCASLTSVTIGNGATSIGDYAFASCYYLTSVTIGNRVTSIGEGAFFNSEVLTSIKYRGTETEWNAISKGMHWDFSSGFHTLTYTITYNYTGE